MERRQFQTEMEVNGRISIDPTDDWLAARLKAVSSDDMNQQLVKLKQDQSKISLEPLIGSDRIYNLLHNSF